MTPIFKNAEIKFEDIGEYMQNYHNENNIKFNKVKINWFILWKRNSIIFTPYKMVSSRRINYY